MVPDCVTVSMYSAGITLRHYDCGTLGAAGIYYASWFKSSTTAPAVAGSTTTSPQGQAVPVASGGKGGDNNQAVGGNGGNVNGNGNTVIYHNGAGRQVVPGSGWVAWGVVGGMLIVLL